MASKITQDTEDLTRLIYGKSAPKQDVTPSEQQVDAMSTSIEPVPVFEYDPEGDKKTLTKMARKTVLAMANHVLSEEILEEEYVKNKIEQDITTLTELYVNRRNNELVLRSMLDSMSKGNNGPQMYNMYTKVQESVNENSKQILATEDNLRKTYLELKYEVESKKAEEYAQPGTLDKIGLPNSLGGGNGQYGVTGGYGTTYTGSKNLLETMKQRQRDRVKKEKSADVEFG